MLALFQFRNRSIFFTTWLILLLINCFPLIVQAATVEGMVFLDENQNGNANKGEQSGGIHRLNSVKSTKKIPK